MRQYQTQMTLLLLVSFVFLCPAEQLLPDQAYQLPIRQIIDDNVIQLPLKPNHPTTRDLGLNLQKLSNSLVSQTAKKMIIMVERWAWLGYHNNNNLSGKYQKFISLKIFIRGQSWLIVLLIQVKLCLAKVRKLKTQGCFPAFINYGDLTRDIFQHLNILNYDPAG